MTTAENVALDRRVDALESQLLAVEPVRVTTRIAVYRRGAEVPCTTIHEVVRNAKLDPVVELVDVHDDLDVLIDTEEGAHIVRGTIDDAEYLDLCRGVRVVAVTIPCHADQVEQILSDAGITATSGGARAGKTQILKWWLLRQWLLRGHGSGEDFERAATFWWIREASEMLYAHAIKYLIDAWPRELFTGVIPGPRTKHPKLYMVDGSVIAFHHANYSGSQAGTNLRSESVDALVVDELSAITNEENWQELLNRVGQTGGPVAVAYTPFLGHWSSEVIEDAALESGGVIKLYTVDMFSNPWWPYARMFLSYLRSRALTKTRLLEVLDADDPREAAKRLITNPKHRARFFGEKLTRGLTLWKKWDRTKHVVGGDARDLDVFELEGAELPNITGELSYLHGGMGRGMRMAGGLDFNVNPGACVVFQMFGDPESPLIYVFDEVVTVGPTRSSAEAIAARFPGLCIACDPTGAGSYRPGAQGPSDVSNADEMEQHGLSCEPANGWTDGKYRNLSQADSINAMHRLMGDGLLRVHERCIATLRALSSMQAKSDGTIYKTSGRNSTSDQISAAGDALRYGVWPAISGFYIGESGVVQG